MVIAFGEWLFAYGKMKVNFRRAEIFHNSAFCTLHSTAAGTYNDIQNAE